MHLTALIICVAGLIISVAILGWVAWTNRRVIRAQRDEIREQREEIGRVQGQLDDYMTGMAALTASIENPQASSGNGTTEAGAKEPRRERWLKAVPPLGAIVTVAATARRHTDRVIAGASVTASAATVGLIAVSTTPVNAPNVSALPPAQATATSTHRSGRSSSGVPPEGKTALTSASTVSTQPATADPGSESLADVPLASSVLSFPSSALTSVLTTSAANTPPSSQEPPTSIPSITSRKHKPPKPPETECLLSFVVGDIHVQECTAR